MHRNRNPCNSFLMVKMASGMDNGRVCPTTTTTTTTTTTSHINRELKQTATAAATGTLLNKRFNEQNNSCARAL